MGCPAWLSPPPSSTILASIVVAAHNAAAFLDHAVSSALAQTCREIEVIAVDDGSSDGTHAALTAWARRDPRVSVLRHAECRGAAAARNTGIAHASGRWVAVLDADDAFLPERIERLLPLAERCGADLLADSLVERDFETGARLGTTSPSAEMAATAVEGREVALAERCGADLLADSLVERDFETGARLGTTSPSAEMAATAVEGREVALADMLRHDRVDLPGRAKFGYLKPIVRRAFLQRTGVRYQPDLRVGEDLLFYFECVLAGGRFMLAPSEALYLYSVREGSASTRNRTGALDLNAATRRMRALSRGRGGAELETLLRERQRATDSDCFDLAIEARRFGDALRYARWADPVRMARRLGAAGRRILGRPGTAHASHPQDEWP